MNQLERGGRESIKPPGPSLVASEANYFWIMEMHVFFGTETRLLVCSLIKPLIITLKGCMNTDRPTHQPYYYNGWFAAWCYVHVMLHSFQTWVRILNWLFAWFYSISPCARILIIVASISITFSALVSV